MVSCCAKGTKDVFESHQFKAYESAASKEAAPLLDALGSGGPLPGAHSFYPMNITAKLECLQHFS